MAKTYQMLTILFLLLSEEQLDALATLGRPFGRTAEEVAVTAIQRYLDLAAYQQSGGTLEHLPALDHKEG